MNFQQKKKDSTKSYKHKKKNKINNTQNKRLESVECPEFMLQNVTLRGPNFDSISESIKQYEKDGWYTLGRILCFDALGYCKQTMQKKVYREDVKNRFWKFREYDEIF